MVIGAKLTLFYVQNVGILCLYQMHRNLQVSKETEDKVKLAKQFIESRYQAILSDEHKQKVTWQRVMKALAQAPLPQTQKKVVALKAMGREASQTRLLRVKDRLSNYQLLGMIGKGAFGDVRLARVRQTDEIVAIKRMAKQRLADKKQVASVFLERECLSVNRSNWLVELRSAFQDQDHLYIAMEWVAGGDLLRLLVEKDIFSQDETRFYVAQLILALEDMHKMNYIHRDIKPDNILIDKKGNLKLTDFGLSKHLSPKQKGRPSQVRHSTKTKSSLQKLTVQRQRHFSKVGTPDYIAPEVLTEQTYDHRVDIWSVGVIMFECLFGYPLFSHEDSKEVCQRVMNWEEYLIFPDTPKSSLEAKLLILGMLSSPQNRLSIPQIKAHPFFLDFNWQKVRQMVPPFIPTLLHQIDTTNFDSFDDAEQWNEDIPKLQRNSHDQRSSSIGYQYNFAGFDWQPRPNNPQLAQTLKTIENMSKKRRTNPQIRRLKTEQTQQERSKIPQNKVIRNSLRMYQKGRKEQKVLRKVVSKYRV